jgi:hypothetical protein
MKKISGRRFSGITIIFIIISFAAYGTHTRSASGLGARNLALQVTSSQGSIGKEIDHGN